MGKQWKLAEFIWGGSQITAAMKLKDACSLEEKLWPTSVQFSSAAQSSLTLCNPILQHARPPCPSPTPRVYSYSCPLSQRCHPTISSSVMPFSSRLQSFPTSGSFQMSQLFASCSQSIGVSASTSVLPMNAQDWSLEWTGWISLQSKGLSRMEYYLAIKRNKSE